MLSFSAGTQSSLGASESSTQPPKLVLFTDTCGLENFAPAGSFAW
jgi:hypothetical protein